MSIHTTDTDVAVVGYGPIGMVVTALLAEAGHRVLVLERYSGLYNLPRAAIFDDETMRTLAKVGIADELVPKLRVQRSYEWYNGDGQLLVEVNFAERGRSGWAEWYMMYQPDLEDALDRTCRDYPTVQVRYNSPVTGIEQTDTGVSLTVAGTEGPNSVTARYVVGCDGGNSFVRQALGIDQHDYGFSEPWMVCDFRFRRQVTLPTARQVGDPQQPKSIISLGPDHHRISFMLDSEAAFETDRQPERVWARAAAYLTPRDADLIRVATYTFRSLVAHHWRIGRVLLAGDAAHQMPPFLGQGMCSGIRDAQNLAFKLDLVLREHASPVLLDTYQTEREPHVRDVIEKGIEYGRVQTVRDPAAAAERDRRLLAQRAAKQQPDKLVFPGLGPGFLVECSASGRGQLSIQDDVSDGVRHGRFDEIVGYGFLLLVTPAVWDELERGGVAGALDCSGIRRVTLAQHPPTDGDPDVVWDISGAYYRWFAEHDIVAAAIRPDFYLYGTARDSAQARQLATELATALGARPETRSTPHRG